MSAIRCFIGLPLPDSYQQGLLGVIDALRRGPCAKESGARISWTKSGNWHQTLKFLGDVEESKLADIKAVLANIPVAAFPFVAAGAGFFPHAKHPSVIWTGVEAGGEESGALAKAIHTALTPLGFTPETRPFKPHLTLGRVRKTGNVNWHTVQSVVSDHEWPTIELDRFILWQSELGPKGPRYTELARFI